MNSTCNIGNFDRTLRLTIGTAIMVIAGLYGSGWALLGVALLATGLVRWCPAYTLVHINTLERPKH